jgi:prephenate dehydrogenase
MKIGIVGLGLMGGSAAKAIRKYTDHIVWGFNRSPEVVGRALEEGVLDAPLTEERLRECDLLLISLYPQAALDYISKHAPIIGKNTTVVDFCGVKRMICRAASPLARQYGFCFIGGHPMAGTERSGYESARYTLFRGASMILTPGPEVPADRLKQYPISSFRSVLAKSSLQRPRSMTG